MIRLIIAGPRDYYDQEKVFRDIHTFQGKFGIDEIISGGASGVDKLAEEYANALLAFDKETKGTRNMIQMARKYHLRGIIVEIGKEVMG